MGGGNQEGFVEMATPGLGSEAWQGWLAEEGIRVVMETRGRGCRWRHLCLEHKVSFGGTWEVTPVGWLESESGGA